MTEHIYQVLGFMGNAFMHIWPYLLITIPLSVAIKVSGISRYIEKAFSAKPLAAIFLATVVGAFSPFCSCGVIPVIASLLMGGVPIAPVMSFWLASPSMDPEIFFLSVSTLGWELAVWRLAGTFLMSLTSGYMTHLLVQKGWLRGRLIRLSETGKHPSAPTGRYGFTGAMTRAIARASVVQPFSKKESIPAGGGCGVDTTSSGGGCAVATVEVTDSSCSCGGSCSDAGEGKTQSLLTRILKESPSAVLLVGKFMALAFFIEALITLYVPEAFIIHILGAGNRFAILTSAAAGLPVYTTNLAALGLMGGLLSQGMNGGAVLAFLVSGATTTIPAMAAVYGLTSKRLFLLYLLFTFIWALLLGYLFWGVLVLAG